MAAMCIMCRIRSSSFMIAKHPVGLEAIKEITRNKNPSESSQM